MVVTVASSLFFASLFALAMAKSETPREMQVHETRMAVPTGFMLVGPAPSDMMLNLRIALAQSDPDGLIDALYSVSDPALSSYGQHLSKEETDVFLAPKAESVAAVNTWLQEYGINATSLSSTGDWLGFTVNVSMANALLSADYSVFSTQPAGKNIIRTLAYSLPVGLQDHIDVVHPTITFPNPIFKKLDSTASFQSSTVGTSVLNVSAACPLDPILTGNYDIDPTCLQYIYDIPTTPATNPLNKLAVAGYDNEYANMADLKLFLQKYRPDMNSSTTFSLATIDGGSNSQNASEAGEESAIDIQYTVGLATNVPVTFISVGDDFHDGLYGYLDTVNYLLGQESPPHVLTTSYSSNEENISQNLAIRLCHAHAALGARGTSVFFSSGDGGVSGTGYSDCTTFIPTFPNTCPYVTSVGGTTLLPTEIAFPGSGGGFSNYFPRPTYQDAAVSAYLDALGDVNAGLYNASGRGFPDVAAYAVLFEIFVDAAPTSAVGTSCSTPTFASVVALLNDRLTAGGRAPMGWLNPWLYSVGAGALTDIVSGNNDACCLNADCTPEYGFNATVGWDPVTGLGTPNFTRMAAALGL